MTLRPFLHQAQIRNRCYAQTGQSSYLTVYELKFTCNLAYFGETKEKILTRTIEHQQDSFKEKWDNSGATEHTLACHGQFNWIHPKTIAGENDYGKRNIRRATRGGEGEGGKPPRPFFENQKK